VSELDWLKEPDKAGDAVVYVSIPEGNKLTPELAEALTRLGKALQDREREMPELSKRQCTDLNPCRQDPICQPQTQRKCYVYSVCRII
jgi:hypothetical protein